MTAEMKRSSLDADAEPLDGSDCIASASGVLQVMMEGSTQGPDKLQVTMVTVSTCLLPFFGVVDVIRSKRSRRPFSLTD